MHALKRKMNGKGRAHTRARCTQTRFGGVAGALSARHVAAQRHRRFVLPEYRYGNHGYVRGDKAHVFKDKRAREENPELRGPEQVGGCPS